MTEMDLLTQFRAHVPLEPVSPAAEEAFRAATTKTVRSERAVVSPASTPSTGRGRRGRGFWRLVVVAPLAIALAAGLTLATAPARPPTAATLLADQAATAALAGPPVRPGQWVYRETGGAPGTKVRENWSTANGSAEAAFIEGTLLTCPQRGRCQPASIGGQPIGLPWPGTDGLSYPALASLPGDPRALVARLEAVADYPGSNRPAGAFELVGRLFGAYLMRPALTAELYRALGDIPGVTVLRDVPDLAGQRGVAFRLPLPPGAGYEEIVIDPRSYQFMGWDSRSADAVYGDAVLVQALVSGPGVRP